MEKQIVGIIEGGGVEGVGANKTTSGEKRSQQLGCEVPSLRLPKAVPSGPHGLRKQAAGSRHKQSLFFRNLSASPGVGEPLSIGKG